MTPWNRCPTGRLIVQAAAALAAAGIENPRLDAEALLAAASHSTRVALVSGSATIDDDARERYAAMVSRRARREPLAYILGRKEFYSLEFEVTPAVLIPRPETETVVTAALEFVAARGNYGGAPVGPAFQPVKMTAWKGCPTSPAGRDACPTILDIGTGSGAIALAIAANAPSARVIATDISAGALAIARWNAARLKVGARVQFRQADCFEPADNLGPLGRFDVIVCNPPYVKDGEIAKLAPEISRYEPRAALSGGRDGMDFYRRIASRLAAHLERYGAAIFEIGADQSTPVAEILSSAGAATIRVIADLAGLPRVVVAYFR